MAWPRSTITAEAFVAALAERLDFTTPLPQAIDAISAADVYLVLDCVHGSRTALAAFETEFLQPLRPAIARLSANATTIDDVLAQVRERLLVPQRDESARLLQFRGRSSLRAWLKVIVVREALTTLRKRDALRDDENDNQLDALLVATDDPELDELRSQYHAEFRAAFGHALESLDPQQRNILRYHLLDKLTIDQIGNLHGVHRSTAARWLVGVRESLYQHTRTQLMERLQLDSAGFRSLLGLVRSQLDYSISRHLALNPRHDGRCE